MTKSIVPVGGFVESNVTWETFPAIASGGALPS